MNEDLDALKGLDMVEIRKVSTYHISTIVSLLLLLGVIIATFVYFVLPMHKSLLTAAFIGGIIAGLYNVVREFIPERHFHLCFKVPDDYAGWKILFLISHCIQYEPEKELIVIQFDEELEDYLEQFLLDTREQ